MMGPFFLGGGGVLGTRAPVTPPPPESESPTSPCPPFVCPQTVQIPLQRSIVTWCPDKGDAKGVGEVGGGGG